MGQLTPGVKYVYESPDGGETVYAREFGKTERVLVGQTDKARSMVDRIQEDKLWGEIRRKAKTNPALHAELERVIMLYHLIEDAPQDFKEL